jgi:CSLREA domain-containing protein
MNNIDVTRGRSRMQAHRVIRVLLAAMILVAAFSTIDPGYAGVSINVNTFKDELNKDGDCSLREAIVAANTDTEVDACPAGLGDDTIFLPKGTFAISIPGLDEDQAQTGDLDLLESVTIQGAGIGETIIEGSMLDRVFDVQPDPDPIVIINEIMPDPNMVSDSVGEWLELFNPTDSDIDINGWTIKDDGSDSHLIDYGSPLFVPAGGYLVLAREYDPGFNGGVGVAYQYAGFLLDNTVDEVILLNGSLIEIDRVVYDDGATFPDPIGATMSLIKPRLDNNVGANWCSATTSYGDGDLGTPGVANDCIPDPTPNIEVLLSGLTIKLGSNASGGGIRNKGDLMLDRVVVENNIGSGILHLRGSLSLVDSGVHGNTASGISAFSPSAPLLEVSLDGTDLQGNGSSGIDCINTVLDVLGGTIEENGFGGIWGSGCRMDLDSVQITNNTTSGDGGGIMAANYAPTLTNTTVGSNTAEGQGGGIYVWGMTGQELQMTGGSIMDNNAQDGAGLYLAAGAATLDGVSVTENRALDFGGGAYVNVNNDAALRLINGTHIGVSGQGNHADFDGDDTGSGGGIYNLGDVSIYDSYIEHNVGAGVESFHDSILEPSVMVTRSEISSNTGSGINAINTTLTIEDGVIENNQWGGIWAMGSPLTMTDSSVSENSTTGDGGGLSLLNVTADVITGSTIDGNAADGEGGGIYYWGFPSGGTLALTNTTISGNHADEHGGGIMVGSGAGSILEMSAVTLVHNIADHDDDNDGDGGGIHNAAGAHAKMKHTLIGLNQDVTSGAGIQYGPNCIGDIESYQYNFVGRLAPSVCTIYGGSNDIIGHFLGPIDPLIGPLLGNGGLTDTHALLRGSPAIEAGEPGACSDVNGAPITTDQRGMTRPIGKACDIGAYEYEHPYEIFLPLIMR